MAKKTSTKTKAILLEENELLRGQVKTLGEKLKEVLNMAGNGDVGEAKHEAIGLFKEDGKYLMVKIAYNPENKACKVISIEPASRIPEASHMAKQSFDQYISDVLFKRLED